MGGGPMGGKPLGGCVKCQKPMGGCICPCPPLPTGDGVPCSECDFNAVSVIHATVIGSTNDFFYLTIGQTFDLTSSLPFGFPGWGGGINHPWTYPDSYPNFPPPPFNIIAQMALGIACLTRPDGSRILAISGTFRVSQPNTGIGFIFFTLGPTPMTSCPRPGMADTYTLNLYFNNGLPGGEMTVGGTVTVLLTA